jgi:hypothetical protein
MGRTRGLDSRTAAMVAGELLLIQRYPFHLSAEQISCPCLFLLRLLMPSFPPMVGSHRLDADLLRPFSGNLAASLA